MRRLLKILLVLANLTVGLGLACAALSCYLAADSHPVAVIASMTLPVWIPLAILVLFCDFFVLRKWTIFMAGCFAIALPMSITVYPLNIARGTVPTDFEKDEWTLLSYNVSNFKDITNEYPGEINPAIAYIMETDADVVVLEEARWLTEVPSFHIDRAQLDALHRRYPTIIIGRDITLLSKFDAEEIEFASFPGQVYDKSLSNSKAGCYRINIHGVPTVVVGVHLKSLGLTRDDKNLYEEFTRGQGLTSKTDIKEAKNDIISKIAKANRQRAIQVKALIEELEKLDCPNLIVCGDFNDTPGCYSLQELQSIGLREVYPLVGTGYMYTYNMDRLLFQIDHVLFRGDMRPWSMSCGNLRISDHYPLLTTFIRR